MEAANTVQRRSITREKSVRLPTMFAQFGSLDDENIPPQRPRRRITEIDVFDKFSDIASSVGEDYGKYGPSHWIHEYSSDTDQSELKSCPGRAITGNDVDKFSAVALSYKQNSDDHIKYYEIDEEGVLELQNQMFRDYYEEHPELRRKSNNLSIRNLITENDFILRIFPLTKEEKPGKDLYNYGVIFQF